MKTEYNLYVLRFGMYIASKAISICAMLIAIIYLMFVLVSIQASKRLVLFTVISLLSILCLWLVAGYLESRRKLKKIREKLSVLPEQELHLGGELFASPVDPIEKEYFDIMREISRSAIGAVEQAKREKQEYCDYVESWVHEMKTPLTACSLILDNDANVSKLRHEIKRADNLTECILYYARLRTSENDLQFSAVSIRTVLDSALQHEMELLIQAGISACVDGDFVIATDPKLFEFIIKQLLINCAKYARGCKIKMRAEQQSVTVEDNGPGIPAHELPRVTQRGFTGARQRTGGSLGSGSTGMGLYIVSELCKKLNITLEISSVENEYTRFCFQFVSLTKM